MTDSKAKSDQAKYPHIKVIVCFSFCPFYVSFFVAVITFLIFTFFGEHDKKSWFEYSLSSLGFIFGATGFGMEFFVPAFILSIFYSLLKVKKTTLGVLFVFMMGGLGAHLWSYIVFFPKNAGLFPGVFIPSSGFLLGFLSSLFAGLVFLPKRTSSLPELSSR